MFAGTHHSYTPLRPKRPMPNYGWLHFNLAVATRPSYGRMNNGDADRGTLLSLNGNKQSGVGCRGCRRGI